MKQSQLKIPSYFYKTILSKATHITQMIAIASLGIFSGIDQSAYARTFESTHEFKLTNPQIPVHIDSASTGTINGICVTFPLNTCPSVSSVANIIDSDTSNAGRIKVPLGVGSSGRIAVQLDSTTYPTGTFAGFALQDNSGLLGANLLSGLTVATYKDGLFQESTVALHLLNLALTNSGIFTVGFTTTKPFNGVQIGVASLVNFDQDFSVYYGVAHLPRPNLTVTVSAPLVIIQGNDFDYAITIGNSSVVSSSGVITLTDVLPTEVSFVSGGGDGFLCGLLSGVVTCTGSPIIPESGSATITITANALNLGTVVNTVQMNGGDDPTEFTSVPVYALISSSNIALPDLTVDLGQPVANLEQGISNTLPITIANIGDGSTSGSFTLTLEIPSNLEVPSVITDGVFTCVNVMNLLNCVSSSVIPSNTNLSLIIPITPVLGTEGALLPAIHLTGTLPGEINIGNNASILIDLEVQAGLPDLTATLGQPVFDLHEGILDYLPMTITNIGTGPTLGVITTSINVPLELGASQQFTSGNSVCITASMLVVCTNLVGNVISGSNLVVYVPILPLTGTAGLNFPGISVTVGTIGEINIGNNTSVPQTVTVTPQEVDITPPNAPEIDTPVNGSVITTTSPLITGTAEISTVVRVYNMGTLICTTIAEQTGQFMCAPSPQLSLGTNVLTATATDADGNTSPSSAPITVTVITNPVINSLVNLLYLPRMLK